MLSSVNADDFTTSKESEMDAQLLVRFFYKERENKQETVAQGRPIYKEVEYIEIRVRGNRDPQACRPATYDDKNRFPRHYEAFKKRVEMPEEGTPLAEWPQISRSQIEEMSFINIKTVEQLSLAADTHIGKMRGGYTLKQRAADWLKASNATALIANNSALKIQIKSLEEKVDRLMSALDSAGANTLAQQVPTTVLDEETTIEEPKPTARKSRRARKD
jgi:hypothetical protein